MVSEGTEQTSVVSNNRVVCEVKEEEVRGSLEFKHLGDKNPLRFSSGEKGEEEMQVVEEAERAEEKEAGLEGRREKEGREVMPLQ